MTPFESTLSILIVPIIALMIFIYLIVRMKQSNAKAKKYMFFLMGFISLTLAYIFYPEPIVSQSLFVEQGDWTTPLAYTAVATFFLFLSVYVFKKHLEA